MRAPLLFRFAFLFVFLFASLSTACGASVKATAPNVANPVLLGPVDRVGGHRAGAAPTMGTLTVVLEDSTAAAGGPGVTTSMTTLGHDPRNVSFWVLWATRANRALDAHIERVSAGGGCLFALFYAQCDERAELVGRATPHQALPEAAPAATEKQVSR